MATAAVQTWIGTAVISRCVARAEFWKDGTEIRESWKGSGPESWWHCVSVDSRHGSQIDGEEVTEVEMPASLDLRTHSNRCACRVPDEKG